MPSILEESTVEAPKAVIWGTNVLIDDCKQKFKLFLRTYIDDDIDDDERAADNNLSSNSPFYMQKLDEVCYFIIRFFFCIKLHIYD